MNNESIACIDKSRNCICGFQSIPCKNKHKVVFPIQNTFTEEGIQCSYNLVGCWPDIFSFGKEGLGEILGRICLFIYKLISKWTQPLII